MSYFTGVKQVSAKQLEAERLARKEGKAPQHKGFNALEALSSIPNSVMKSQVAAIVSKAVESYDLVGTRMVSYYDQAAELANDETIFSDMVEANGIVMSTDFQINWRENYAGTNLVEFFNLNAGLPVETNMLRAVRSNTMGAYGNQLRIPIITQELAAQSPINPHNEEAEQLRMQLLKMRRFRNSKFLVNTEIKSEIIGDTPQWGGFYTRSTTYADVASAADLTAALIQTKVNQIANATSDQGIGFHTPLVCLTTSAQIANVRSAMISRFTNAESSTDYLANQARIAAMLPGVKIDPDMTVLFKPNPGRAVLFIHEPQLSSGVALFMVPSLPRIAKFSMMGQVGPWVLSRPTPELTNLLAIFDFESIIDPLLPSRASYTGLN